MTDTLVPVLAPADTLLGMLQRGRGAGYLAALTLPPDEVHPCLLQCITDDPRWDSQLEERTWYYGSLAVAVGLEVDGLLPRLGRDDVDACSRLVIPTLGIMAGRGHAGARETLCACVRHGDACADAIEALAAVPDAWASVEAAVCERFGSDGDLIHGLDLHHRYLGAEPWLTWTSSESRLGAVLRRLQREDEEDQKRRAEEPAIPVPATLADAIAAYLDDPQYCRLRQIESLAQPADTESMLELVRSGNPRQRQAALRAIASIRPACALPDLVALAEEDIATGLGPGLRGGLKRALESLPPEVTLPTARQWYDGSSLGHIGYADCILMSHATREDLPRLIMGLDRAAGLGEWYDVAFTVQALRLLGNPIPVEPIERAFRDADYSRVRMYASEALADANPERFAQNLAVESLWDCEPGVREVACYCADLEAPGVRARLEAILCDPLEDEDVSAAARVRLGREATWCLTQWTALSQPYSAQGCLTDDTQRRVLYDLQPAPQVRT